MGGEEKHRRGEGGVVRGGTCKLEGNVLLLLTIFTAILKSLDPALDRLAKCITHVRIHDFGTAVRVLY